MVLWSGSKWRALVVYLFISLANRWHWTNTLGEEMMNFGELMIDKKKRLHRSFSSRTQKVVSKWFFNEKLMARSVLDDVHSNRKRKQRICVATAIKNRGERDRKLIWGIFTRRLMDLLVATSTMTRSDENWMLTNDKTQNSRWRRARAFFYACQLLGESA